MRNSSAAERIQDILNVHLADQKLNFIRLSNDTQDLWMKVINKCSFVPVFYELFWIDYQVSYQEGRYDEVVPVCQILTYADQPVAAWPLALCRKGDMWHCEGMWGYIREPVYVDSASKKMVRRINRVIFDALKAVKSQFQIEKLEIIHQNWLSNEPGPLHRLCAEQGYKTHVSYASVIDFDQEWEYIWSQIRKSYKNLTNVALNTLQMEMIDQHNPKESVFREFQNLHFQVAGRKTRPQKTWDIQWKAITQGNCFLITLRHEDELIGGGLFSHNSHFGEYWVAAYRKDMPEFSFIGHGVLGAAIKHLYGIGIKLFFVGERHYSGDVWWPFGHPHDERWLAISDFKAGFATRYAFVFFHCL